MPPPSSEEAFRKAVREGRIRATTGCEACGVFHEGETFAGTSPFETVPNFFIPGIDIRGMGFFENLGELNVRLLKRRRDVDGLIKVLQTGAHPESREEAAEALGDIRDHKAVVPLIGALTDRDHEVREEAAKALGMIGDKKAVEPLNEALKDTDAKVRREAELALARLR